MQRQRVHRFIALGLSLVFFSLAILATPSSVRHALIHAGHTATQHTTFICTWMCAATTFVQTSHVVLEMSLAPRLADLPRPAAGVIQAAPAAASARAPPA